MRATAENGDAWTGEKDGDWWIYEDPNGNIYSSIEIPCYRIKMDNSQLVTINGKQAIAPNGLQ